MYVLATTALLLLLSAAVGDAMRVGFERACLHLALYDRKENDMLEEKRVHFLFVRGLNLSI